MNQNVVHMTTFGAKKNQNLGDTEFRTFHNLVCPTFYFIFRISKCRIS